MFITDPVTISLIGAAATVVLALLNGVFAIISNARGKRNEEHLVETKNAVNQVRVQTDGMTERIAKLANEKGVLEGHAQGMADAGTVPVMMQPQAEVKPEVKRSLLDKLKGK